MVFTCFRCNVVHIVLHIGPTPQSKYMCLKSKMADQNGRQTVLIKGINQNHSIQHFYLYNITAGAS